VVPSGAKLTPRNPAFPAWDSLPEDQRRLYARQMEVTDSAVSINR
jgi:hypothetical protein